MKVKGLIIMISTIAAIGLVSGGYGLWHEILKIDVSGLTVVQSVYEEDSIAPSFVDSGDK